MPTYPNDNLTQARPDLQMIAMSQDLLAAQQEYIGSQMVPDLPVETLMGKYPYVDNATWLKDPFEEIAPMGALPRYKIDFSEKTFQCGFRGFEMPINRDLAVLYKDWLALEKFTAEAARTAAAYHREAHAVSLFNNDSCYGTSTDVETQWTNHASAKPLEDLQALIEAVGDKCGVDPNTIVMSKKTFNDMINCEEVVDRVKSATSGSGKIEKPTAQSIADFLGVKRILVGGTRVLTESGGSRSFPRLWTNSRVAVFVALESKEQAIYPHWASHVVFKPDVNVDYGQTPIGSIDNCEFYSYGEPQTRSGIIQCIEYSQFILADINCAGKLTNICS